MSDAAKARVQPVARMAQPLYQGVAPVQTPAHPTYPAYPGPPAQGQAQTYPQGASGPATVYTTGPTVIPPPYSPYPHGTPSGQVASVPGVVMTGVAPVAPTNPQGGAPAMPPLPLPGGGAISFPIMGAQPVAAAAALPAAQPPAPQAMSYPVAGSSAQAWPALQTVLWSLSTPQGQAALAQRLAEILGTDQVRMHLAEALQSTLSHPGMTGPLRDTLRQQIKELLADPDVSSSILSGLLQAVQTRVATA